jgi:hypothetical protein
MQHHDKALRAAPRETRLQRIRRHFPHDTDVFRRGSGDAGTKGRKHDYLAMHLPASIQERSVEPC